MLHLFIHVHHRGFFCDDESLMHPFHESTVTYKVLYSIGISSPLFIIFITELMKKIHNLDIEKNSKIFGRTYPSWLKHFFKFCGIFLLGAIFTVLITHIMKRYIGRYRPHFISVCQPLIPPGNTTCSDPSNLKRYILKYFCNNADATADMVIEMQSSFPSGHASFSVYTMTFAAFYIHFCMNWCHRIGPRFVKMYLQSMFIAFALLTSLSRFADYQSHGKFMQNCKIYCIRFDFFIQSEYLFSIQGLMFLRDRV